MKPAFSSCLCYARMYFVNMQSAGYAFSFMKVIEKGDIPLEGSYWIKRR